MREMELFDYIPEKSRRSLLKRIKESPILPSSDSPDTADTVDIADLFSALRRERISKPVIFVGAGTCGLGAGADKTLGAIKKYLEAKEIDADVLEVGCIGLCSAEPMVDVRLPGKNRLSFRNISADKVEALLDELLSKQPVHVPWEYVLGQFRPGNPAQKVWKDVPFLDEHPFFSPQSRWVLANCGIIDPGNIDEYLANGGYGAFVKAIYSLTPAEVCETVEKSGLRGRGGGGFPTGRKWTFALNTDAEQTYMVCNADEGDPGAFMDRAIIEGDPHRLLEGLSVASYAIGATKAYIYIRAEYPLAIQRLKTAIADAKEYGFLGTNIMDSGFSLDITIKKGAGAFVCGEETALLHSIEGKRGMPRPRPPYPAASGLFGKPTIINNVETLANIPPIVQRGYEAFSGVGTENSKGTKVFAISGKVRRTGLIEVEMGTSIREIVFDIGGGIPGDLAFKGVQIGGPSGGCIPSAHLDIQVDYESLKTVGAMMGSGGLVVMDEKTCMVDLAAFFMDFIQRESCGKCIPCREGTKRMLEILKAISRSRRNEGGKDTLIRFKGIMTLEQLADVIKDTSLCGLGQSAPNPVLSTLRWFKEEYEEHIFNRRCPAGVCTELLSYTIDAETCTGCTACMRKCPADAIMGKPKTPHYIIPDKCVGCGNCIDICRFGAVNAV